jgi:hypothetical protein
MWMEVGGWVNEGFGDFEFDLRTGKLFRGSRRVQIQPSPLSVLAVLLKSAGETVLVNLYEAACVAMRPSSNSTKGLNYYIRQGSADAASKLRACRDVGKEGIARFGI